MLQWLVEMGVYGMEGTKGGHSYPKNTLHGACGRAVFHENEIIEGLPARLLGSLGRM